MLRVPQISRLTGTEDQGQAMDVAVHVGTLFAVMLYFWRDMIGLVAGTLNILTGKLSTPNAKLVLLLILATIPVIIAGLILMVRSRCRNHGPLASGRPYSGYIQIGRNDHRVALFGL